VPAAQQHRDIGEKMKMISLRDEQMKKKETREREDSGWSIIEGWRRRVTLSGTNVRHLYRIGWRWPRRAL
jgi:hypothetical protein